MISRKEINNLQKYFVDQEEEHFLEFGFNTEGDFILIENFSSWLNKDVKWAVQFNIAKSQIESLDEENRQYFDNLKKNIRRLYDDWYDTGFIAGLQIEDNGDYLYFLSNEFEYNLQIKKINYTKYYNTVDGTNEKGIQKELEIVENTEDHEIHMGISPMGNMIFGEEFSNTERYLQEPYENVEIHWYVRFCINKSDWDNLDKKTMELILNYKEKTKKKYEDYYNDFPADIQMTNGKEFISNEYELTLQKNNIAYTKILYSL